MISNRCVAHCLPGPKISAFKGNMLERKCVPVLLQWLVNYWSVFTCYVTSFCSNRVTLSHHLVSEWKSHNRQRFTFSCGTLANVDLTQNLIWYTSFVGNTVLLHTQIQFVVWKEIHSTPFTPGKLVEHGIKLVWIFFFKSNPDTIQIHDAWYNNK